MADAASAHARADDIVLPGAEASSSASEPATGGMAEAPIVLEEGEAPPVESHQDPQLEAQVLIGGLNKWSTVKQVKDMLERLGVCGIRKVRKQQNEGYGFVYFNTVADRYAAQPKIEGFVWRKAALTIETALPLDRNRFAKRQAAAEAAGGERPAKRARDDAEGDSVGPGDGDGRGNADLSGQVCSGEGSGAQSSQHDRTGQAVQSAGSEAPRTAADAVAPLHRVPYEEQLKRKGRAMLKALRKLPAEMHRASKSCQPERRAEWMRAPLPPRSVRSGSALRSSGWKRPRCRPKACARRLMRSSPPPHTKTRTHPTQAPR